MSMGPVKERVSPPTVGWSCCLAVLVFAVLFVVWAVVIYWVVAR